MRFFANHWALIFAAMSAVKSNIIEEFKWRGLLQDSMPGIEQHMNAHVTTGYVGFDPTSSSLTIGNLCTIMQLVHLQNAGHKPIALVGGATGMIGDPSGKSAERNLLDLDKLRANQEAVQKQLEHFLDFDGPNAAQVVNNYDWMSKFSFLDFLREVGKHLTVNYMMSKDSVKSRLATGLSFTEFSYQLIQGYDFLHLYQNYGVKMQMGGSDQWGNITSGTELIRRIAHGEAYALTCPLLTRADGTKFGKSAEGENIWLDGKMTSPFKFYQFLLNSGDEEASKLVRVFTTWDRETIESLEAKHQTEPHLRGLQKALALDLTTRLHGSDATKQAIQATELLFGAGTTEVLQSFDEETLLSVMEGVPQAVVPMSVLREGVSLIELLTSNTDIYSSKGEMRKAVQNGGLSLNKTKVADAQYVVSEGDLLSDKYVLAQKGKKQYFLIRFE